MITCTEWKRPAASGEGQIFSRLWAPQQPIAILMLAHGMAEHSARYDAFARYLAARGVAVCMNDHAGHGNSDGTRGYFGGQNGWDCLLTDLHSLAAEVKAQYPRLPFVLMGHSMGSFLARCYLTRYPDELSAAVICGTMGASPAVFAGKAVAALQRVLFGAEKPGRLLDKMASAGRLRGIEAPVNQFAWLSANRQNCMDYAADPSCGFVFTIGGFYDMFGGIAACNSASWYASLPKGLPCLLVAGKDDPVGDWGKGVQQVYSRMRDAGVQDVSLTLYPNMRHEILNEDDRDTVFADIADWLLHRLPTHPDSAR